MTSKYRIENLCQKRCVVYPKSEHRLTNPARAGERQSQSILVSVSRLYVLRAANGCAERLCDMEGGTRLLMRNPRRP
jgi:hypothetical protein